MRPIDHRKATAKVTIDGLAICGFMRSTKLWEVTFLRETDPMHELTLTIEGLSPDPVMTSVQTVEIVTVNGDPPDFVEYPAGCFYESNVGRNSENMRWALNLKNKDDVGESLSLKRPDVSVTVLRIQNALFYVSRLFPNDLYRVPAELTDPNVTAEKFRFGPTSDELAADVFCQPGGEVQVLIDGQTVVSLPHDPSRVKPYSIGFRNMDRSPKPHPNPPLQGPLEKGDFECYY